ncbi:MAG: hypothetical protein GY926_19300 [bacterium]|nr:hypothetical protein [bacterium]
MSFTQQQTSDPSTINVWSSTSLIGLDVAVLAAHTMYQLNATTTEPLGPCLRPSNKQLADLASADPAQPLLHTQTVATCSQTIPNHDVATLSTLYSLATTHMTQHASLLDTATAHAAHDGQQPLQLLLNLP